MNIREPLVRLFYQAFQPGTPGGNIFSIRAETQILPAEMRGIKASPAAKRRTMQPTACPELVEGAQAVGSQSGRIRLAPEGAKESDKGTEDAIPPKPTKHLESFLRRLRPLIFLQPPPLCPPLNPMLRSHPCPKALLFPRPKPGTLMSGHVNV